MRLYDGATGTLVAGPAGEPALLWVCGITPYDATHLGHAATYLTFDLLLRAWRDAGRTVRYAQNVTDVDDPLLERARSTGQDWRALADREIELFRSDMAALRILPPDVYVGVAESLPQIIELIARLRDRGASYELDGDVYFAIAAATSFGSVAGLDRARMLARSAEHGGDPQRAGKKDPLDALLWRAAREGEPAWDSPFGPGRPGWHVECAALALHHLGPTVDVAGGGTDLAFPHHELTAAQASVASGVTPFARANVHRGMLGLDGAKMSKSRGNLVLVGDLLRRGADPAAIRLALAGRHYRQDWEWTGQVLDAAGQRLRRWRAAARLPDASGGTRLLAELRAALAADLDTPAALAAVDAWADAALAGPPAASRSAAEPDPRQVVDALLGVALPGPPG